MSWHGKSYPLYLGRCQSFLLPLSILEKAVWKRKFGEERQGRVLLVSLLHSSPVLSSSSYFHSVSLLLFQFRKWGGGAIKGIGQTEGVAQCQPVAWDDGLSLMKMPALPILNSFRLCLGLGFVFSIGLCHYKDDSSIHSRIIETNGDEDLNRPFKLQGVIKIQRWKNMIAKWFVERGWGRDFFVGVFFGWGWIGKNISSEETYYSQKPGVQNNLSKRTL